MIFKLLRNLKVSSEERYQTGHKFDDSVEPIPKEILDQLKLTPDYFEILSMEPVKKATPTLRKRS